MTSALQRQVNRIKDATFQPTPLHKGRASLFLDPKEAASVDISTIYDSAEKAVNTLHHYDKRFSRFLETILHSSSIQIQRELKSAEENHSIDKEIAHLTQLLTLYGGEESTHKILEYLIRRYQANEFNTDSLIKCMLPYHDTKVFARLIQLSTLSNSIWNFLEGVKKSGAPPPRQVLVFQCTKDASFVAALCQIARSSIQLASSTSDIAPMKGATHILSFFTAIIIETIETKRLSEQHLQSLFPFLIEGFQSIGSRMDIKELWRKSSSMIFAQILRKNQLANPLLHSFVTVILETFMKTHLAGRSQDIGLELIMPLTVLATFQQFEFSGNSSIVRIFSLSEAVAKTHDDHDHDQDLIASPFLQAITIFNNEFDVTALLQSLVQGLLTDIQHGFDKAESLSTSESRLLDQHQRTLLWLMGSNLLNDQTITFTLQQLATTVAVSADTQMKSYNYQIFMDIFRKASQLYPVVLNASLTRIVSDLKKKDEDQQNIALFQKFLSITFNDAPQNVPAGNEGLGLLLSLQHSSIQIRVQAIQTFETTISFDKIEVDPKSLDFIGLAQAVFQSLTDTNVEIALAVCTPGIVKRLFLLLPVQDLIQRIDKMVKYWIGKFIQLPNNYENLLAAVVRCLCDRDIVTIVASCASVTLYDDQRDVSMGGAQWLFLTLLPFILEFPGVPLKSTESKLSKDDSKREISDKNETLKIKQNLSRLVAISLSTIQNADITFPFNQFQFSDKSQKKSNKKSKSNDHHSTQNDDSSSPQDAATLYLAQQVIDNEANIIDTLNISSSYFKAILKYIEQASVYDLATSLETQLIAFLTMLQSICEKVLSHPAVDDKKIALPLLSKSIHLSLQLFHTSGIAEATTDAAMEIFKRSILVYATLTKENEIRKSEFSNITTLVEHIYDAIREDETEFMILSSILTARSQQVVELFGPCLQALFVNDYLYALVRLANATTVPSKDHHHTGQQNAAKIGSLMSIGIYLEQLVKSKKNIPQSVSSLLLTLCPTVLTTITSEHRSLREASLSVAKSLSLLSRYDGDTTSSTVVIPKKKGTHNPTSVGNQIHIIDFAIFGLYLIQATDLIRSDENTPHAILSSINFHMHESKDRSQGDVASLNSLRSGLLWVVSEIGWVSPETALSVILLYYRNNLAELWPCIKHLFDHPKSTGASATHLSTELVNCLENSLDEVPNAVQRDIKAWVFDKISSIKKVDRHNLVVVSMYDALLGLLERGWANKNFDEDTRCDVFTKLFDGNMLKSISFPINRPISALDIPLTKLVSVLAHEIKQFVSTWDSNSNGTQMEVDESDDDENTESSRPKIGLAEPLQRLSNAIEILKEPLLKKCGADLSSTRDESEFLSVSQLIPSLFHVLQLLNSPSMRSVLLCEFVQGLIIDICVISCEYWQNHPLRKLNIPQPTPSKSNKKKTKASSNAERSSAFNLTQIDGDIEVVLEALELSRTYPVQRSSLGLLSKLVDISPESIFPSISTLGNILTEATTAGVSRYEGNNKDKIIGEILQTFLLILSRVQVETNSQYNPCILQLIIQPLCRNFSKLPPQRRSSLMAIVLNSLGNISTPICITVLLCLVLTSYESDDYSHSDPPQGECEEGGDGNKKGEFILLSRAAQKKATRLIKSSLPEEIFNLAVDMMIGRPAEVSMNSLIVIVRCAIVLANTIIDPSTDKVVRQPTSTSSTEDPIVDIELLVHYSKELVATDESVEPLAGGGEALCLVLLEFVIEALQNKAFHRSIASYVLTSAEAAFSLKEKFLQFAEGLLQLVSVSSDLQEHSASTSELLHLRLGKTTTVALTVDNFGRQTWTWSMEILRSLQGLLDTPTFLAILQELLGHEQDTVRQRALGILSDRLRTTSSNLKSAEEVILYHDLAKNLLGTIKSTFEDMNSLTKSSCSIGQSALLCLDILSARLGQQSDWHDFLSETLSELIKILLECNNENQSFPLEELKGSLLLCCGTLCGCIKARALPQLAVLIGDILATCERYYKVLVRVYEAKSGSSQDSMAQDEEHVKLSKKKKKSKKEVDTADSIETTNDSAVILLLRSAVSAAATICVTLPNFCHPYLSRLLVTLVSMRTSHMSDLLADAQSIEGDVDKCLYAAMTAIPLRLSLPVLLQDHVVILGTGHDCVYRLSVTLRDSWTNLKRDVVVPHLSQLLAFMTLLLDYRYKYGEQDSVASEAVEDMIIEAIIELCLKLTENELRSWLNRLSEWCDANSLRSTIQSPSEGTQPTSLWRLFSRGVSFVTLLHQLVERLKGIFVTTISVHWTFLSECIEEFINLTKPSKESKDTNQSSSSSSNSSSAKVKKGVKRSLKSAMDNIAFDDMRNDPSIVRELILRSERAMSCIISTSSFAPTGFIDEFRYNPLMTHVLSTYDSRRLFESDDDFESYCDELSTPTVTALAQGVSKDTLWKPVNYKLLMLTREKKPVVRMVALRALKKLFVDIAEDYLIMLPECIPFLSELLEDDSDEVVRQAAELVRYIEDLSGEKLDSYLA